MSPTQTHPSWIGAIRETTCDLSVGATVNRLDSLLLLVDHSQQRLNIRIFSHDFGDEEKLSLIPQRCRLLVNVPIDEMPIVIASPLMYRSLITDIEISFVPIIDIREIPSIQRLSIVSMEEGDEFFESWSVLQSSMLERFVMISSHMELSKLSRPIDARWVTFDTSDPTAAYENDDQEDFDEIEDDDEALHLIVNRSHFGQVERLKLKNPSGCVTVHLDDFPQLFELSIESRRCELIASLPTPHLHTLKLVCQEHVSISPCVTFTTLTCNRTDAPVCSKLRQLTLIGALRGGTASLIRLPPQISILVEELGVSSTTCTAAFGHCLLNRQVPFACRWSFWLLQHNFDFKLLDRILCACTPDEAATFEWNRFNISNVEMQCTIVQQLIAAQSRFHLQFNWKALLNADFCEEARNLVYLLSIHSLPLHVSVASPLLLV